MVQAFKHLLSNYLLAEDERDFNERVEVVERCSLLTEWLTLTTVLVLVCEMVPLALVTRACVCVSLGVRELVCLPDIAFKSKLLNKTGMYINLANTDQTIHRLS